jgi:hypothetical protein
MMGGPMIGQAMGGNTGMMIGMGLGQVASMLPFITKGALNLQRIIKFTTYGVLITSVIAVGKYLLNLKKNYEDVGEANRLAFGGNETTLGEAGLAGKYKTLSTRLKDINDQLDLQRAKARASYDANTKTGVNGLTLTIKQLREETARVKKEMPETLAAFNNIDSSKVNNLAVSLKSQYVAMGMSVEKATNSIYSLIAASNKSSQAISAISSSAFKDITDKSSAAAASVKLVGNAISAMNGSTSKGFIEEMNTGIDQMINSLSLYQSSLVGTKGGADGKTELTEADALKKTLEEISKVKVANNVIDQKTLNSLKEQNLVYATILRNGETLQSIYAKTAIYAAGLADKLNIAAMTGKQAVDFANNLAVYQGVLNDISTSTEASNPLSSIAKLYNTAKTAANNATNASKAAQKFDSKYYNDKIKAIEDVIRGLEKERDLRLKLLDVAQATADFEKSLREEQIKYQEALASGDLASAAQSQLNIKKIQEDRQRELTKASIIDSAQKEIDAKQAEIDRLRAEAERLSNSVSSYGTTAAKKTSDAAQIKSYMDRINNIVVRNPSGNFNKEDQLLLTSIFTEMEKAGGNIKKAADEMKKKYPGAPSGPPSFAGGQPVGTTPEVAIAKALADQVNGKSGVFSSAVDKFILAVNTFAGVTGKPFSPSGDKAKPIKAGPITTPFKASYMRFSSADGKKKIQVATLTSDEKSAYDEYTANGWKFIESATQKDKSTEYTYNKLNPFNKVPKAAMGGLIDAYLGGGKVVGPGTSMSDSIPAFLSNGEYVIKASSVNRYGIKMFDEINAQRFNSGAIPSPSFTIPKDPASIGNNQITGYNRGGSVHHYNAGGIVVNGAQGQDVKELASHIVTIMDARGNRRNSMNGGGIVV